MKMRKRKQMMKGLEAAALDFADLDYNCVADAAAAAAVGNEAVVGVVAVAADADAVVGSQCAHHR
jgi:hypothetical protein